MIDFRQPYKRKAYLDFFRDYFLPEDFSVSEEKLDYKTEHIQDAVKLADVPSLDLTIYEVQHKSEHDPRVSLSRDTFRMLSEYSKSKALVLFTPKSKANYRLSLVTIDITWEEGKRVKKEYSNPRRYSFYLGPDTKTHTPDEYLIKKGRIKDIDDLKDRFSIEVVNKEFYTQIAVLFTQLAGGKRTIGRKSIDAGRGLLNLPGTVDDTLDKEFTVRLLGRLVFCWFLKKKRSSNDIPLLPEELLSANGVKKNKGYYHGILEPLFFEVLNTPVNDRDKKYQSKPWSQIPFLNGGLFTPHHHDFYDPGPLGISKHINTLKVPDHWIKELFEIFETYNFTIDENTSVDVEISIEPEMLGRIFENLLAEINPETGETARKATGSYYTPRPIVEYMVDESLKQYLLTKTKLDEEKIKSLLTYEDLAIKLTASEKESVLSALDAIRVIDPACGSGAFPMGILQKMLLILQKVDPESEWWLDKKLAQVENKLLKKELGKKLKAENVNYVHKFGIIQSSIYGVDIQPIAVEISKLRFFLSLIVDEKINDQKENRGVEHLPNLEFKFVCANTLIGLPEQKKPEDELFESEDTRSINELKDLRDEYLRSYGIEKEKIQIKFLKIQKKMVEFYWKRITRPQYYLSGEEKKIRKQEEPKFTRMLSSWDPFADESVGWFDPEWMFGIKDGFDIVIANPPYVNIVNLPGYLRNTYRDTFSVTKNKVDLYAYFIEKGLTLLKKEAVLSYIVPQTWKAITSFSKLRDLMFSKYCLLEIVDLDFGVFDAVVKPVIIFMLNEKKLDYEILVKNKSFQVVNKICIQEVLNNNQHELDTQSPAEFKSIFSHIEKDSIPLGQILHFSRGIKTSNDKKFITSYIGKLSHEYHKVFRGKNIKSYSMEWGNEYVWYRPDLMRKKVGCLPHSKEFFEVPEKIVTQRVNSSMRLLAAYDNQKRYFLDTVNVSDYKTWRQDLSMQYLCALLNSKVINFYYCNKFRMPTIGGYELHSIPIKIGSEAIHKKITTLVNAIMSFDNCDSERAQLIKQIDSIVFEIYDLAKKEINIIENFFIRRDKNNGHNRH